MILHRFRLRENASYTHAEHVLPLLRAARSEKIRGLLLQESAPA